MFKKEDVLYILRQFYNVDTAEKTFGKFEKWYRKHKSSLKGYTLEMLVYTFLHN